MSLVATQLFFSFFLELRCDRPPQMFISPHMALLAKSLDTPGIDQMPPCQLAGQLPTAWLYVLDIFLLNSLLLKVIIHLFFISPFY